MRRAMTRRGFWASLLVLLAAPALLAQTVAVMPNDDIVVAHDGRIELFKRRTRTSIASFAGVGTPGAIAVSADRVAVLDPLANSVRLIDLKSGRATLIRTGETPVAALFAGRDLYVLARDARALERIGEDGSRTSIATGADAQSLRLVNGRLYVYARGDGRLQEIERQPFAVSREVRVAPFASDVEIDAQNAYFVYPREGVMRLVTLSTFKPAGESKVGAVPIDIAFTSGGTALTARTMAVADPASRRVWMIEGKQSVLEAFGRGFLRGLLGLGLFGGGQAAFSTGVDRVLVRGSFWLAYDSSSGTLYRFTKSRNIILAKNIRPAAFALTPTGAVYWHNGTLVAAEQGR